MPAPLFRELGSGYSVGIGFWCRDGRRLDVDNCFLMCLGAMTDQGEAQSTIIRTPRSKRARDRVVRYSMDSGIPKNILCMNLLPATAVPTTVVLSPQH